MTLQQLIYVVTVADETSMNRAAQRLYLAQSSLSAGIHSLEEELGFSLFRRSMLSLLVCKYHFYYTTIPKAWK